MEVDFPIKALQNSSFSIEFPNIPEIADPYALVRLQVKKNSNATKIELSMDILPTDPGCDFENGLVVANFIPGHTRGILSDSIYQYDLMVTRQGKISYPYRGSFEVIGTITRNGDSFNPVEFQSILEKLASTVTGFGAWMIGVDASYWTTLLGSPNLILERCLRWLNENKLSKLNPFTGSKLLKSGTTALEVLESGIGIDSLNNLSGVKTLTLLDAPTDNAHATRKDWVESKITTDISTAISNLINGAPGALDTFGELAAMFGNDPNWTATVINLLASKIPLSQKGVANGVASLGTDGKVPSSQLPPSAASVTSVNGMTGAVTIPNPILDPFASAKRKTAVVNDLETGLVFKSYFDLHDFKHSGRLLSPSTSVPWMRADVDVASMSATNYKDFVPYLLGFNYSSDFGNTTVYSATVEIATNPRLTLTNNQIHSDLIRHLLDDLKFSSWNESGNDYDPLDAIRFSNWGMVLEIVTSTATGIAVGSKLAITFGTSLIQSLDPASRIIRVGATTATTGSITFRVKPYVRIADTNARWRRIDDAVLQSGFAGLRRIDESQIHKHTISNVAEESGAANWNFGAGVLSFVNKTTSDPTSSTGFGVFRGGNKNRPRAGGSYLYVFIGEYT